MLYVPTLDDNGVAIKEKKVELLTVRKGVRLNQMNTLSELKQMISLLTYSIDLDSGELSSYIINKLRYLGFEKAIISVVADMKFKDKVQAVACNYLAYQYGELSYPQLINIYNKIKAEL